MIISRIFAFPCPSRFVNFRDESTPGRNDSRGREMLINAGFIGARDFANRPAENSLISLISILIMGLRLLQAGIHISCVRKITQPTEIYSSDFKTCYRRIRVH